MAFGQSSGPAATARQVQQLLELLQDAGHADFRDARGPLGFTQRQASGKFTRDEAEQLIADLESAAHQGSAIDLTAAPVRAATTKSKAKSKASPSPTATRAMSAADRALRAVPTPQLAAELQRRGWIVVEP